jgi:hypothetical protein
LDQGGGHDQKFSSEGQIEVLHEVNVFQILPGDQRDRNVVNIDLIFANEMKKEVERTRK